VLNLSEAEQYAMAVGRKRLRRIDPSRLIPLDEQHPAVLDVSSSR
jgi:hypothetical protein